MHILVIGGAGRVARWVVPHLRRNLDVTTFDRVAPADIVGDALDPSSVATAMTGVDAVVHLAVVVPRGEEEEDPDVLREAWAVNVGSWWLALDQGRRAGVRTFIHGSTMSVHARFGIDPMPDPAGTEPDATRAYGFSKRVAETAGCLYARQFGLHVTSLRLAFPTPDDVAPAWLRPDTGQATTVVLSDGSVVPATKASRVAEFIERGLTFRGEYQCLDVTGVGTRRGTRSSTRPYG